MQNTRAEPGHGSQVQGKVYMYMLAWTLEPHLAVNIEHMRSLLYSVRVYLMLLSGQLSQPKFGRFSFCLLSPLIVLSWLHHKVSSNWYSVIWSLMLSSGVHPLHPS